MRWVLVMLLLTACKPQAPCLKSHTEIIMVWQSTGKSGFMRPMPVTRCDVHCTLIDEQAKCVVWQKELKKWEAEHADE